MIPQPGNIIVVFFRNGVQLEGEVLEWTDEKSVLKSPAGASIIVIQKTLDDVMFYKFSNAKNDYEKLREKPRKEEDDIKTMARLKNDLNELERAELREKLTNHTADGIREIKYGLPNINSKIPGLIKHTREKAPRENTIISPELQNLFSKKH